MMERVVCISLTVKPTDAGTLGNTYAYFTVPCDLMIIGLSASPHTDDPGLTVDINDDGSGAITALACATAATPGTWVSTHLGGTNAPVRVAADSVVSLDANNAAANTVITVESTR